MNVRALLLPLGVAALALLAGCRSCPECQPCPVCPQVEAPPPEADPEPEAQLPPGPCTEEWVHMPVLITFPTGGAVLDQQNRMILAEVVRTAQGRDDIRTVRVEGHTDTCGREVNNQSLSEQRATVVRDTLIEMGVPGDRVEAHGYGSTQPRANEDCRRRRGQNLSRQTNRRVEFSILTCREATAGSP